MNQQETYNLIEAHYRKHAKFLMKALSRTSGGLHNAEDAVQEAYTNALTYWNTYDEEQGPLAAWFSPILKNAIKKIRRDESSRGITAVSGSAEFKDYKEALFDAGQQSVAFDNALIAEVETMIDGEREDTARVLTLALIHQLPYSDIAKLVPQNVNNIQSLVYGFRKRLTARYAAAPA